MAAVTKGQGGQGIKGPTRGPRARGAKDSTCRHLGPPSWRVQRCGQADLPRQSRAQSWWAGRWLRNAKANGMAISARPRNIKTPGAVPGATSTRRFAFAHATRAPKNCYPALVFGILSIPCWHRLAPYCLGAASAIQWLRSPLTARPGPARRGPLMRTRIDHFRFWIMPGNPLCSRLKVRSKIYTVLTATLPGPLGMRRSSSLAPRVSTLAPLFQAGWDQLSPAAAALCVTRKASSADKMPRAPTPGAEPDHLPSLARRPSPCPLGPREATPIAFPPRCDSAGQGPSDGDGGPSQAEPESSALPNHPLPRVSKVRSMGPEADGITAVQAPSETSDKGRPRRSPRRQWRVSAAAGKANEAQQPPKDNARRQDGYDNPSPPRKRRKISLLGSAATRLAQPGGSSSRPRRAPTSGPAQSRSGRRSAGPSSSLQGPGAEREMPPSPTARFEEWALPDTVLKRVVIKDRVTFQLQFTWDSAQITNRKTLQAFAHWRSHQPPGAAPRSPVPCRGWPLRRKKTRFSER